MEFDLRKLSDNDLILQYKSLRKKLYSGYMGERRKKLVNKFGFDPKNLAHCVRLLRMSIEYLETGELNVYRYEDAKELIEIKLGEWPLDKILAETDKLFARAEEAFKKCTLPEEPPIDKIEKMLISILYDYIKCNWKES